VKLENVLHRAATGQSLSDKEPANSRRASAWWVGEMWKTTGLPKENHHKSSEVGFPHC